MQVETILRSMGGNGLYSGYESMAMCIRMTLEDSKRLLALQKEVYAVVAESQNISVSCLKRRLDIFLNVLWRNGTPAQWRRLGLSPVDRPTVGEFIEAVVWYIQKTEDERKRECRKRRIS